MVRTEDWSKRTMKFDGKYTGEDVSTMAQAGSELMDQSLESLGVQEKHSFQREDPSCWCLPKDWPYII